MSDRSGIEWTDATWNPVTGCTKVSAGCKFCYAETWAHRGLGAFKGGRAFTDVQLHPDKLDAPLRWRKPRRVFVNSMSDLFHEVVPDEFIVSVFGVMANASQHTFQILTKRPDRMQQFMSRLQWKAGLGIVEISGNKHLLPRLPFLDGSDYWRPIVPGGQPTERRLEGYVAPNVWLGVSVEDQPTAATRVPLLLQTPAAVRFLSCEPLLHPVDLTSVVVMDHSLDALRGRWCADRPNCLVTDKGDGAIDWVIVGGESGPQARPCDVANVYSLIKQCRAAGVAVFVKQLGANCGYSGDRGEWFQGRSSTSAEECGYENIRRLRHSKGGDPSEWPTALRIREMPPLSEVSA